MADALRVALIGYGLAGRVIHRPLLQAEGRLAVTHVVTADPVRRSQAAADLPTALLVDDAEALWRVADDIDVVVVATPNSSHLPLALAALELGKAVVVDKPLAITVRDAETLAARARDLGVPLAVFHNRRWDSDTLAAGELIASGALGDVVRLESRFTRFRPEVADRWREDAGEGGGVLLDLGTHVVDQALHLLGPATSVYAEVDVRRQGARADDDCFVALLHASGVRSHLWCSMAAPVPGPRLLLQGTSAGWSKEHLDGQEDAQRVGRPTPPEEHGRIWAEDGEHAVPSPPGDWGAFYRAFAAAVLDGADVPIRAEEAVTVLRVLEAARRSSARGAVVGLDEPA